MLSGITNSSAQNVQQAGFQSWKFFDKQLDRSKIKQQAHQLTSTAIQRLRERQPMPGVDVSTAKNGNRLTVTV